MIKEKTSKDEEIKFKGKYIYAIGRRKTSIAQIRLYDKGAGIIIVNNKKANEYFSESQLNDLIQPLKLSGLNKEINISIKAIGGGKYGQAAAGRHGLVKALINYKKELRPAFKAKGLITRDSRIKERKKPGLKRARRAPQWAKR